MTGCVSRGRTAVQDEIWGFDPGGESVEVADNGGLTGLDEREEEVALVAPAEVR